MITSAEMSPSTTGYLETNNNANGRAYDVAKISRWHLATLFGPLGGRISGCLDKIKSLPTKAQHLVDVGAGTGPMMWKGVADHELPHLYTAFDSDPNVYDFSLNMWQFLEQQLRTNGGLSEADYKKHLGEDKVSNPMALAMLDGYRKKGNALFSSLLSDLSKLEVSSEEISATGMIEQTDSSEASALRKFQVNYRYKDDIVGSPDRVATYFNSQIPPESGSPFENFDFGIQNADTITLVGINENFNDFGAYLDLLKQIVAKTNAKDILFTGLEKEQQDTFKGMMQRIMSKIGPAIMGAHAPDLHYHGQMENKTIDALPEFKIETENQFGARILVHLSRT